MMPDLATSHGAEAIEYGLRSGDPLQAEHHRLAGREREIERRADRDSGGAMRGVAWVICRTGTVIMQAQDPKTLRP